MLCILIKCAKTSFSLAKEIIHTLLNLIWFRKLKISTTKNCHHTAGTLAKMFSSSLLQSALFCASAIMSGGSCLIAVVANLRIQICGQV